jgi:hypothetical protein
MAESSSPLNRPTHWPREQGLSPGARSNPSRPGGAQNDSVPAQGTPSSGASNPPEPSRADALRGVVDQHLLKHRMLHLSERELPAGLSAALKSRQE